MNYLKLLLITGLVLGFFSCSKEISEEKTNTILPPAGDCRISQVVPYDKATNKARGAYILEKNNDLPSKVILYDSITGNTVFSIGFTYRKDSVVMGEGEYFVLHADGKVKELVIHEYPGNSGSEQFRYKYYYDELGYLKLKEWYLLSSQDTAPLFVYNYFWDNGNLVRCEVREGKGEKRLVMTSEITYDLSLRAKDFLYCFPESNELSPFILMIDLGKKAKNLPVRVVVQLYNANGVAEDKYVTDYKDYVFTQEGYVAELLIEGDVVDGLSVVQGLTKFNYTCK